ncbi:MAG TPA: hypothetical protein VIP77_22635 [Jiangellaceae bacterium]
MPRYVFQESRIWEAGDPIDPDGRVHRTRQRTLARARKHLPAPDVGRRWVLISIDGEPATEAHGSETPAEDSHDRT